MPVGSASIEDGLLYLFERCVVGAGRGVDSSCSAAGGPDWDLGESILMPGLVNAHCHLDYTDLAGEIAPTKLFTDWIKTITTAKAGKIYADFAQSWVRGARMLLRTGAPTVADTEAVHELLPEIRQATPLRVFSF